MPRVKSVKHRERQISRVLSDTMSRLSPGLDTFVLRSYYGNVMVATGPLSPRYL